MQVNDIVRFAESQYRYSTDRGPRMIGIENEYPVVTRTGEGIPWSTLAYLWAELAKRGWEMHRDGTTREIIAATKVRPGLENAPYRNYDTIETDTGFHTMEISLAPTQTVQEAEEVSGTLLSMVSEIFAERDAVILGYGIQPFTGPRAENLAPKGRYRFFEEDSSNYFISADEGIDLHALTLSAASQTHVEVSSDEAIAAVNAISALAGLRVMLFANSPVWKGMVSEYKAIRQLFWGWCYPDRASQVGIPPRFHDFHQYIDYILDFRQQTIKRGDTYYKLDYHKPFRDFITNDSGSTGTTVAGEKELLHPRLEDINFECGIAWLDARLQPAYGTIEERSCCQQPYGSQFAPAALNLGLIENLDATIELANQLSRDQWRGVRSSACIYGMQASLPGTDLQMLLRKMVDIANKGLQKRGLGEEMYLIPLYQRIIHQRCPGDDILEWFSDGGVEELVRYCDIRTALVPVKVLE